ncbi:MAG: protoporphyrinogen/coproporphyrinogen oxidase, partial [Terriglobales bacterium]
MVGERSRAAAVIVGAGIAGLSAAWELDRRGQGDTWVLEAESQPGGVVQTCAEAGFLMEAGPDSFLTAKPAAAELCAELGLTGERIGTLPSPGAQIYHRGRLRPLPAGWRLAAPTRLGPLLRSPLLSPGVKAQLALRWRSAPAAPRAEESAAAYLRRRFGARAGQALAETVAGPLLAGVYGGDVEQLAAAEVRGGDTGGSNRGPAAAPANLTTFTSLRSGMATLVQALAEQLPAGSVRLNCRATAVNAAEGGFRITLAPDQTVETARLILAGPAWAAAELVCGLD